MKTVRAVKLGFLPGPAIHRVRPGQVVEVPDDYEADWFVPVGAVQAAPKRRQQPVSLSEVAKAQAKGPTDDI